MAEKRYYWLKLHDDFFGSKRIKKLRKLAGGDTYTIIYLKMQLKAMKNDGILSWTELEDNFASEIALDIDENPDDVTVTLQYLLSCGLAEASDPKHIFLPFSVENTGSEVGSTQRSRECRKRKMLQCNTNATLLQQNCNVEIEKEKEIEIDKSESKREEGAGRRPASRFTPPALEEVKDYCSERGNQVDPERFIDYYSANGWMVGKSKMKDWKAAIRNWERSDAEKARKAREEESILSPEFLARHADNWGGDADDE